MQPVLNIEDIRRVEQGLAEMGISLPELMHRAGIAVAQEVLRMGDVKQAVVFVGLGNNGGDGWVAAEELRSHGIVVRVVSAAAPQDLKGDLARPYAQSAQEAGVEILVAPPRPEVEDLLDRADIALDAIFGTGFRGVPSAPFDIWIDCMNSSAAQVVAVDVPSGLSAQTGLADGAFVVADVTVTMLALKPGLISDQGRDACGSIVVAPLANETEELVIDAEPTAQRAELPDYLDIVASPSLSVDKFTRGSVLVVGGSTRFTGAPMLSALAAARAGAGYVTLAVPAAIAPIVQAQMLEVPVIALPALEDGTFGPGAADVVERLADTRSAVLVGPGMCVTPYAQEVVSRLLGVDVPLVIDADGLNCLAEATDNRLDLHPDMLRRESPLVLTPHRGELGRLVGRPDSPPDSLHASLEAARAIVWADGGSEICVVAKGSATACVYTEAAVLPKPGPAALATAGSGDVLGGIITSLLSQVKVANGSLALLCALGCEIHGYAGSVAAERFGSRGVIARDVIDAVGIASDTLFERISFPEMAYQG